MLQLSQGLPVIDIESPSSEGGEGEVIFNDETLFEAKFLQNTNGSIEYFPTINCADLIPKINGLSSNFERVLASFGSDQTLCPDTASY